MRSPYMLSSSLGQYGSSLLSITRIIWICPILSCSNSSFLLKSVGRESQVSVKLTIEKEELFCHTAGVARQRSPPHLVACVAVVGKGRLRQW